MLRIFVYGQLNEAINKPHFANFERVEIQGMMMGHIY